MLGVVSFGVLVPTFFIPIPLASSEHFIAITVAIVTSWIVWEGSKLIQSIVSHFFSWDKSIVEHLIYEILFIFILSAIALVFALFIFSQFIYIDNPITLGVIFQNIFVSFALALLFTAINEGTFLFRKWKSSLVEQERILHQSKIESLKKQLDPHFLFNSLSVLSGVVHEDPELAEEFITKMSQVYRYVIEQNENKEVAIEEEIRFVEAYFFLLKVRFGDKIVLELDCRHTKSIYVLPLSIQLLVENAVKHNAMSQKLVLIIETDNDFIKVRNTLVKRKNETDSTGIGLQNLSARYQLITSQTIQVIESKDTFEVVLPSIIKL